MYDQYFNEILRLYPSLASFLGDRHSDGRVENSWSPEFRKSIRALHIKYSSKYHKLSQKERSMLDVIILKYILDETKESFKYPFELMPISSFHNVILEYTLMENTIYPFHPKNIISRHHCYIRNIQQCIMNMRKGMRKGVVIPKRICHKMIDDIDEFLKNKSYLTQKALNNSRISKFMENKYRPCIEALLRFLKDVYVHACRHTIGMCDLPNGKTMYHYMVRSETTINAISVKDIHEYGKNEVVRILKEFKKLIPRFYPSDNIPNTPPPKTVLEFLHRVKDDPRNYFDNTQQILDAYKQQQTILRETVMKKYFYANTQTYEIKKVPKMLEASSAGAFYYPGNNSRPGRFFINLRSVRENPKYSIETLAIHEGEPGHHYQFQYMLEKKLPLHRIFGCESTAYAEGWALYAESLSMTSNHVFNFGRLTYEMFRAVRCVVDTGVHYYGWSFEEALSYMKKHIAMQESELVTELERYICIPGQAVSYKIGERFFQTERQLFLRNNHNKTIKDYHESVLKHGVIPLTILQKTLTDEI